MLKLLLLVLTATMGVPMVPAIGPTAEAQVSEYQKGLGIRMLRRIRSELEEHYWDPDFRGQNLDVLDYRAQQALESATHVGEIYGAIAQFLASLNDSHTRFVPPGLSVRADYGWAWQSIGDNCYVVDVDGGSDAAKQGLRVGDRVLAIDGLRPDRQGLKIISYVYYILSPRERMTVTVERPDGTREDISFEADLERLPPNVDIMNVESRQFYLANFRGGELRHDWKTFDSVAVWRFSSFGYQDERLDLYMEEARDYPWLILDLRGNPGGSVEAEIRFIGHFFGEEFKLLTTASRDTTIDRMVPPRGDEPYSGEVLVLVDSRTGSAAEITARALQMRGRAMIVGDRTSGAVVTSRRLSFELESSGRIVPYGMTITVNDVIMPDGNRLEDVGVIPNVPALPTGADIAAGRDPAMQFALEMAGIRMTAEEAGRVWR